jgi:hypothetical protein
MLVPEPSVFEVCLRTAVAFMLVLVACGRAEQKRAETQRQLDNCWDLHAGRVSYERTPAVQMCLRMQYNWPKDSALNASYDRAIAERARADPLRAK